jgi:hypothetical protein
MQADLMQADLMQADLMQADLMQVDLMQAPRWPRGLTRLPRRARRGPPAQAHPRRLTPSR